MELMINGHRIDFEAGNEKTVKELSASMRDWSMARGLVLSSVNADGRELSFESDEPLAGFTTIDYTILSRADLILDTLEEADAYCTRVSDYIAQGSAGAVAPATIAEGLTWLGDILRKVFSLLELSADEFVYQGESAGARISRLDGIAEAVAEKFFGQGRDTSDFVLVHLGYGIGAGIIVGGHLYTGNFGVSGEIGHTSVDRRHGKWCDCGNRGCLELYAGLRAIIEDCSAQAGRQLSFAEIEELAGQGDAGTLAVLKEKGELVGYIMVNLVNTLAPQRIIFTGQVAALGAPILEPMKRVMAQRCFYHVADEVSVTVSSLSVNSSLLGAMTVVLDDFLENPYDFLASRPGRRAGAPGTGA